MTPARWNTIAAATALFALAFAWRVLTFPGFQNDHYVHLARAQQLLLGDVPLRDFADPGMPLMYLVSAAVWSVWGGSLGTEVFLVAAAFAAGAVCTFVIARQLSGSMVVATAAAVLEVLIAPRTYSYPKVLLYAAAAWALVAVVKSPSRWRIVLVAVLTAVAFLFRHDHGLYIGVAGAVAVALATTGFGWRAMARQVAMFVAVAALFVVPWLAFVEYEQGLIVYFESGLEFSRAEATRNRGPFSFPDFTVSTSEGLFHVRPPQRPTAIVEWKAGTTEATRRAIEQRYGLEPVPTSDNPPREYYGPRSASLTLRALVDDPHVADVSGLDRFIEWSSRDALLAWLSPERLEAGTGWHVYANAHVWLFYVFHALPFACALFAWRRQRSGQERWRGESAAVASVAVLAVLVNAGLLRGNLQVWLPDAIAPAMILGAWFVPVAWNAAVSQRPLRLAARTTLAAGVVVTAIAIAVVGDLHSQIDRSNARGGFRGMAARAVDLRSRLSRTHRDAGMTASGVSDALLPFFEYVDRCTAPGDRLMMTQLYPDVFVLAGRGFAGGQVAFMEGFYTSAADQEWTLARLRRESVPFVLLMRNREDAFRGSFDRLSAYIDGRYRPMTTIPVEQTDAVRVLLDTQRPPVRMDDKTGWPCFT